MPGSRTLSPAEPTVVAEQPFTEPWQAQAFAMTVHLHQQGVFTWSQWAEALSAELHRPDTADDGSDYYHRWVDALSTLLVDHRISTPTQIDDLAEAWSRAAHATPHGQPIQLENDPNGGLDATC